MCKSRLTPFTISPTEAGQIITDQMLGGLSNAGKESGYGTKPARSFVSAAGEIVNVLLSFLGVVFLILIIYGGYLWLTAGGNEEQIKKAKGIIKTSIIGIVIILSARIISEFVIRQINL